MSYSRRSLISRSSPSVIFCARIQRMFAVPAHTAEGRRAKVTVLLRCIMGHEWTQTDIETEYPELQARNLLIDFVGGEPGACVQSVRRRFLATNHPYV